MRLLLFAVAAFVVVAAVVGLISSDVVHRKITPDTDNKKDPLATTSNKAVAAICGPTDYKQACVDSLSTVATNQSATPKDYIQAAIDNAIREVKTALERSGTIGKSLNESGQKMAVADCEDLLRFAIDELEAAFTTVGNSELHTITDREAELRNWLSAVISYQASCLDRCEDQNLKDLKVSMANELQNSTQLTSNALAIVSTMADVLKALDIPVNGTSTSRRLLEDGKDGYPSWLSAADRKLLAVNNANIVPNAVVAKDGSGQFRTIDAALAAYPKNNKGRYTIYVKAGIYDEYITVGKDQVNVFMYGDGPRKTIVTGRKCNTMGIGTMQTASFGIQLSLIYFSLSICP